MCFLEDLSKLTVQLFTENYAEKINKILVGILNYMASPTVLSKYGSHCSAEIGDTF